TVYSMDRNVTRDGRSRLNITKASDAELSGRLGQAGMEQGEINQIIRFKRRLRQLTSGGDLMLAPGADEVALAVMMDELTTADATGRPGKINVNTASKEVLEGLPGLTENDVNTIMGARTSGGDELATPAWLLKVLSKPKLRAIFDLVTTRSDQFTIHV